MVSEALALLATFIINVPFGYWRAGTEKMSKEWFAAIHSPVPLVIALRYLSSATIQHIPFFVLAYFFGQLSGSKIREAFSKRIDVSKCFVTDVRKFLNYLKALHR